MARNWTLRSEKERSETGPIKTLLSMKELEITSFFRLLLSDSQKCVFSNSCLNGGPDFEKEETFHVLTGPNKEDDVLQVRRKHLIEPKRGTKYTHYYLCYSRSPTYFTYVRFESHVNEGVRDVRYLAFHQIGKYTQKGHPSIKRAPFLLALTKKVSISPFSPFDLIHFVRGEYWMNK